MLIVLTPQVSLERETFGWQESPRGAPAAIDSDGDATGPSFSMTMLEIVRSWEPRRIDSHVPRQALKKKKSPPVASYCGKHSGDDTGLVQQAGCEPSSGLSWVAALRDLDVCGQWLHPWQAIHPLVVGSVFGPLISFSLKLIPFLF